ncbi:DUF2306 domain-containing protein [Arthrobacter sp. I2-34]|uniref:DUF2306 domain-containing protein n=1 Tax=Arthrobacter hankyongi TaxID=2904801 RepID=A0ABS9L8Z0_9MICC|nr:DUF2306 domain-containing protein [Arthrobacter hankyongi]MCG2623153.1 DUF2306 domain-containing protein [Arthrobacter hankyongi]
MPTGLILLSFLPILGGAARLTELTIGAEITPQNERFFDAPVPVFLHIVSVTVYSLLGAFQFVSSLRARSWHRVAGRVLVPAGLLAAFSGLWLALVYFLANDGTILLILRLIIGSSKVVSIARGLSYMMRSRDFVRHRGWMTRSYAIGAAAGTEALLIIGPEILFNPPDSTAQVVFTGAAWVINLAVAEYVIHRRARAAADDDPGVYAVTAID